MTGCARMVAGVEGRLTWISGVGFAIIAAGEERGYGENTSRDWIGVSQGRIALGGLDRE